MKKISVLVLFFMLIFSSNALAANWVWVTSNDECTLYIDCNNVKFETSRFSDGMIYIYCYARYVNLEENEYGVKSIIQKTKFRVNGYEDVTNVSNVRSCITSSISYDSSGHLIASNSYPEIWTDVMPDTFASALYFITWQYYRK